MAESTIITGQFVRISQTPASIGERLMALIIDYFLIGLYILSTITLLSKLSLPSGFSLFFFLCVVYLPILGYSFLCEMFNHGQSFGKKLINIRVVKVDGSTQASALICYDGFFSQLMVPSQVALDFWSFY